MATGDIPPPGMESPGGGNCRLRPMALRSLFDLGEDVVHPVPHKLRNRQSPRRRKRSQAQVLLLRQLYLGANHPITLAQTYHHANT